MPVQGPNSLTFLLAFEIRSGFRHNVIQLLAIRSPQMLAHATTAQLSCHVQSFVAITFSELRKEQKEISIAFELRWENFSEMDTV